MQRALGDLWAPSGDLWPPPLTITDFFKFYYSTFKKIVFFAFVGGFRRSDPKVMGTIETGLSRQFIWHFGKSNWTDGY